MSRPLLVQERRERAAPLLYFYSSVFWLIVGAAAGALLAFAAVNPFLLQGTPLTYGRLQPAYTGILIFGWLSMALMGFALYVTPRLTRVPLRHEGLARAGAWLQNVAVAAGSLGVLGGSTTGRMYAEWVPPVAILWLLGLVAAGYALLANVRERDGDELDVSLWYFGGAVIWMVALQLFGGGLGSRTAAAGGFGDALLNWFYARGLFGLWLGMMALGVVYFLAPRLVGRPVYSLRLAALAFWGMAALYPVTGSHLMAEPVPAWMRQAAVVLGLLLVVPVWALFTNLFRTVEGQWGRLWGSPAGRFLALGLVLTFCLWVKTVVQLVPAVSEALQFTYWSAAYDQLALLGAFTFVAFAGVYEAVPRLTGRSWVSDSLTGLHFWLSAVGVVLMATALARAGLVQGGGWAAGMAFDRVLEAVRPHLVTGAWAALLVILGQLAFAYNLVKTATSDRSVTPAPDLPGLPGEAT